MQTKEHLHKHNVAAGMLTRSLSKRARSSNNLSAAEFWLLMPFMMIVVFPILFFCAIFYILGILVEKIIWCLVANQNDASCVRVVFVRFLNFIRISLMTPAYVCTFIAMHTFMVNIVQGIGVMNFSNNFEMIIWGRLHGKTNPMESHHDFKNLHSRTNREHSMKVMEKDKALEELRNLYGADSEQYRNALTKVHDEIDSGAHMSGTKVVPVQSKDDNDAVNIRKVVSVKVLSGAHIGHVVHKQFRGERLTMSFGTDPKQCDVILNMDEHISGEHSFIQYHTESRCFYYVDDSTNGSSVCGEQCIKGQPVVISDGVYCELGATKCVVHIRDMYSDEEEHDSTEEDTDSNEEDEIKDDASSKTENNDTVITTKRRKFKRRATSKSFCFPTYLFDLFDLIDLIDLIDVLFVIFVVFVAFCIGDQFNTHFFLSLWFLLSICTLISII
jgi:hypothetical protein